MRRKRILELSKEEVEATCDRYEVAVKDGYPWSRNKTASCVICRNPDIRRFNVVMLEGKTPYDVIKRDFNFATSEIYRHWATHLAPYIDPEFSRKTVLAAVDRVGAHRLYPTAASESRQFRWVVSQLLIARKVLLEEIEGGMPLRVANADALHDYIEVLMKIKDLILQMISPPKYKDTLDFHYVLRPIADYYIHLTQEVTLSLLTLETHYKFPKLRYLWK